MSNLSAFPYIAERSEGTPGLWNYPFSIISANIAALDSGLTSSSPSGNTFSFLTNIEASGGAHFQFLSVGSTPPSYVTTAAITVRVNSGTSDYLYLTDSAAQKSSYIIGSRAGGLADGLNIWDASAGTMIASFSKQSIRFFQNVVGPVFDTGGALAATYNAATFIGSGSSLSGIQAAINQASIDGIKRVYLPASMYPYSASSISFIYTVRMVREGGDWSRYDALAYGAAGNGIADDTDPLKATAAASGFAGGIAFLPAGTYSVRSTVYWRGDTMVLGDGRGVTIISRRSTSVTDIYPNLSGAIFRTGPSDGTDYLPGSHGNYVAFQDFTIDGNADVISSRVSITNVNLTLHGIRAHHVDYLQTNRVEIRNCLESGMYLWGCRRSAHFGTVARRNGLIGVASARNGIHLTGPQDSNTTQGAQDEHLFFGCSTVSNQDEGLSAGQNGQVVLVGGVFRDNGDHGIEGDSGTLSSYVTYVPAGWTISGAYVSNNGSTGIAISNSNVQRVAISGNVVENNAGNGIAAAATSGALISITGNTLTSNGTTSSSFHGILVNSGFSSVAITGNVVDGANLSAGAGIVLTAQQAARIVSIAGNTVTGYGTNGISVAGQATGIIANNSVVSLLGAFSDGIIVFASTASLDNLDIAHNLVLNTREYGIRVRSTSTWNASNIRIRDNTATDVQTTKTQTYGLSFDTANTGSLLSIRVDGNDFGGNLTGTIQNFVPSMTAISPYESTSSVSFGATFDATRGIFSLGTTFLKAGTAINPSFGFSSETSLGLFRSGSSVIQQSYGTFAASNYSSMNAGGGAVEFTSRSGNVFSHNVTNGTYFFDLGTVQFRNGNHNGTAQGALYVGDGSLTTLGFGFTSDLSLGFYRSANSTIAQSFGTLDLTKSGMVTSIASLTIKSGANNACGTAVLGSNGSVNVANTYVKTGDLIFLTDQTAGGTLGDLEIGGIRNSSGFTILSTSVTDTSTVAWLIIRPG